MSFLNSILNLEEIFRDFGQLSEERTPQDPFDVDKYFATDSPKNHQCSTRDTPFIQRISTETTQANSPLASTRTSSEQTSPKNCANLNSDFLANDNEENLLTSKPEIRITRSKSLLNSPKNKDVPLMTPSTIDDGQNKMKNHQGSIAGKIKKFCQEDTRLFIEGTISLSPEKRKEFREWTSSELKKSYKTWTSIMKFLNLKLEFGRIFVDMINLFLSERFKAEYEEWLDEGSMIEQTKVLLKEQSGKDFYLAKFNLIIDHLSGKVADISRELNQSRKSLKKLKTNESSLINNLYSITNTYSNLSS